MEISINISSSAPLYEQIFSQICEAVNCGALPPGSALPSIRQLANDLEINPNTVAKAYQILDQKGIILTAGRRGTFVKDGAAKSVDSHRETHFSSGLKQLLSSSLHAGLSVSKIEEIFNQTINELEQNKD